jgi:hypothetical protein
MTNEQLQQLAQNLAKQYKDEIVKDGDWWHGTDTHSFNIHCLDDECDGWYNVNVYKVDPVTGMDNYEWMIDLPRVYLGKSEDTIQMRQDLANAGYAIPASKTFSDYDTLDDTIYITAQELEGAVQGDDPADPDDHPFCYVQLKDGRSLYFISADLDFEVTA